MSKMLLWVLAACLLLSSISCVVIVKDEKHEPSEPCYTPGDPVIAEIDAVAQLSFDSHRNDAYMKIAQRDGLPEHAQVHLVYQSLKHLSFENMKEGVIMALINNGSFSCGAQKAILSQLKKFDFENSKQNILNAINQHNPCTG